MKVAVSKKLLLATAAVTLAAALPTITPLSSPDVSPPALEHIAALLLVVGCYDDVSQCRELPPPVSIFETKEECDRQLPNAIGAVTEEFEQLFAQCLQVDPAVDEEDARLVWGVHPDGTLVAFVEAVPIQNTEPSDELVAFARLNQRTDPSWMPARQTSASLAVDKSAEGSRTKEMTTSPFGMVEPSEVGGCHKSTKREDDGEYQTLSRS